MSVIVLLATVGLSAAPGTQSATLSLVDPGRPYEVQPHLEYLEDKRRTLTAEEVSRPALAGEWRSARGHSLNFGYRRSAYWARISVTDGSTAIHSLWYLHMTYAQMDHIQVYYDGKLMYRTGDALPFWSRPIQHREFVFPLPLRPGKDLSILMRFESSGTMVFPIVMRSGLNLHSSSRNEQLFFGIFWGIMAAMALYNLFLYFAVRDASYLLYVLYIGSVLLYVMNGSGLAMEYFWPERPEFSTIGHAYLLSIFAIFAVLFTRSFLNAPVTLPWINRVMLGFVGFFFASLLWIPMVSYQTASQALVGAAIPALFMLVTSGIVALVRGYRPARFYLVAWGAMTTGGLVMALRSFGVFPNTFLTHESLTIGASLEVILLSFALADRINLLRQEKIDAQREAIASQQTAIESLERVDRLKDDFLAGITHELRTPLQCIVSLIREAREVRSPSVNKDETGELILVSALRLTRLVDDILDYSRLKHSDLPLSLQPVNLASVAAYVVGLNAVLARTKGIALRSDVATALPLVVADPEKLIRVLQSLVENGIRHTDSGFVAISAEIAGDLVLLRVRDSGPGLPAERGEQLFEPYEQGHSNGNGTGLGLSIARDLMKAMRGRLTIDAGYVGGAGFCCELPLASIPDGQRPPEDLPAGLPKRSPEDEARNASVRYGELYGSTEHGSILVIDDEPTNVHVMERCLAAETFARTYVPTAEEGLRLLLEPGVLPRYSLVVLDVMLPGMSGFEALQVIRENYDARRLPVLLVTVRHSNEDLARALSAGANDYLVRPFEPSVLRARVRNLMSAAARENERHNAHALEKAAARKERSRIFSDLHDHLGARLTDLGLISQRLRQGQPDSPLVSELASLVDETTDHLRQRLTGFEDMTIMAENFPLGLHTFLLRRYERAGRLLSFEANGSKSLLNAPELEHVTEALFLIAQEICTNDVKYGHDRATWRLAVEEELVTLQMETPTSYRLDHHGSGNGTSIVQMRSAAVGGQLKMEIDENRFSVSLRIPLSVYSHHP